MAKSLGSLRSDSRVSVHGRQLAIDANDFIVGFKGTRTPVTNATSDTTATAIPNHGFATVVTSTNDTWTLDSPAVGAEVKVMTGSSSTGTHTVSLTNATLKSSNGIASSSILLQGAGAYVSLVGLSTGEWGITSHLQTTGGGSVQFSS